MKPDLPTTNFLDRILTALGDTEAPRGIESRILQHLSSPVKRTNRSSRFLAVFHTAPQTHHFSSRLGLTIAATAALALLAFTPILRSHHHTSTLIAHSFPRPSITAQVPAIATTTPHTPTFANVTQHSTPSTPVSAASTPSSDPDVVALEETLAPSHPAPPMPLTAQEHLMLNAMRPGQPIEVAELEVVRQPALHALAEAHQRAGIRDYIESLLAPLTAAETINPTSAPPTQDVSSSVSEPPTSK